MSGRRIGDLLIKIAADSYEFQSKMQKTSSEMAAFAKKTEKLGKQMSMMITAPVMALGAATVYLADEACRAEAKVQQALKSTNGVVGLNLEQLKAYATELQGKTIFGDDEILDKSTAQLLTFTNIAGENFKRAQAVAMDLTTVLNGDLQGASIQLGKALNDPVKSLSALRKSGIQFSNEQEAVIKKLASTGEMAKAQSMMLAELERQYGGQAEAAARVGAGSLKQLKNSWGDFLEQIGVAILPTLNKLVDMLKGVVDWLQKLSPETKSTIVLFAGLAAAVGPVVLALSGAIKMFSFMKVGVLALLNPVSLAITAIGLLVAAIYKYKTLTSGKMEDWENQQLGLKNWTVDEAVKAYENSNKELAKLKAEREKIVSKVKSYNKNPEESGISYDEVSSLRKQLMNYGEFIKAQENVVASRLKLIDTVKSQTSATSEATTITDALKNAMVDLGEIEITANGVEKATGLIAQLSEQVAELEKQKANATSIDDIAAFNAKIEETKTKIENLNAVTVEYLQSRKTMATVGGVATNMDFKGVEVTPTITAKPIINIDEAVTTTTDKLSEFSQQVSISMQSLMMDTVGILGDSIGSMIVGDMGLDGLLESILSRIGDFIAELGQQVIIAAGIMELFQIAIESLGWNPWVAAAIGVAMVIAGKTLSAALSKQASAGVPKLANGGLAYGATYAMVGDNPNARVDPEVIAPLSKLKAMLTPSQREGGTGGNVKFVIEGDALVGILGKYQKKLKYT